MVQITTSVKLKIKWTHYLVLRRLDNMFSIYLVKIEVIIDLTLHGFSSCK